MRLLAQFAVLIFPALIPSMALAGTYDLGTDFSLAGNPNGNWSYGFAPSLASPVTLYDLPSVGSGFAAYPHWHSSAIPNVFDVPLVGVSASLPVEGIMHGGPNNELSIARLTMPESGTFTIAGVFKQTDVGRVDCYIRKNGAIIFSVPDADNDVPFNLNQSLGIGDQVDFVLGTAGSFLSDTTNVIATVYVPEPGLGVLAIAAVGVCGRRARLFFSPNCPANSL